MVATKKNGGGETVERQFVVIFCCPCGNTVNLRLNLRAGAPSALSIPEYRCVVCPGFPMMARSAVQEIDVQRIQPATIIPHLKPV